MAQTVGPGPGGSFPWQDTREWLGAFAAALPGVRADAEGRAFVAGGDGGGPRLVLPLLLPGARPGEVPTAYVGRLSVRIGRQCVLLLQAGAAAMGLWDEDELVRHRARRKYVVRGHGKAQPKHLRTRGKSRYGARLRMQNWRALLVEVNATLQEWWDEIGAPEQVFWSVPVRAWGELAVAGPSPPFDRGHAGSHRIPFHVHRPDFEELQRVRRRLARGRWLVP
jgi:hypothetical protein